MIFVDKLLSALPGACAQGLIWGLMAIGVYITFKVLDLADLTVDGTMAAGGAVCIVLTTGGMNIWLAMLCAFLVGMLAGAATGILHTFMGTRPPRRYPDTASAVFHQSAHYGW